ncbi:MAG TPA: branched-chain amino acid ABC transporter permease [Tepidisphaeraceae bacterium]|jgi:branched-chain amino acid transport system permease protein|nr:branched-chain amino acid ABC transporter permease [Tepidisphaeraceae bacterium]
MHALIEQLLIGLSIGATYALIALGYTMVYGVLRLINFAHGDVYMVGAVVGYYIAGQLIGHMPPWLVLVAVFLGAVVACCILGYLIELLAYRPLRNRPRLVLLITAIGVSLLLENLCQLPFIFGPTPRSYPPEVREAFGRYFAPVTLGLSLVLMTLLTWMVMKTKTGLALRAVSFRFDAAQLMGINTNRIISLTFMFGSGLAAVAGVLDAMRYDVRPLMGVMPGLKAFIAAVLGGIGNIPGALVGGLLIGIIETLLRGVILPPAYTSYTDAAAFVILIVILLVKPSGLLGRATQEKV